MPKTRDLDHESIASGTGSDLQAFVIKMRCWPGDNNARNAKASAFDVLKQNETLTLAPLTLKTLKEGYVAAVGAALRSGMPQYSYTDPFAGAKTEYPETALPPVPAEPLSADRISTIFRIGVKSGLMDNAMLPLLGHLTGRRLI